MAQRVDERRREPRAELALECTLKRRIGAPISCRTVDVGTGGMSVLSGRPLATDELLAFELGDGVTGRATVLRQQTHQVYALAFTQLADAARATLADLVARR
jgi:hypothetical protein